MWKAYVALAATGAKASSNCLKELRSLYVLIFPGDHGEEVTPVPISNTEVKGFSGDGTAANGCWRVARCRDFILARSGNPGTGFFLISHNR